MFFKHFVIKGEHQEFDEALMRKVLALENRSRLVKIVYSDMSQEDKEDRMLDRILKQH